METLNGRIEGIEPIMLNNPQCVDPFNRYSRAKKKITSKRNRTDEDLLDLRKLDIESKVYFNEELGVYVPSTWLMAALAGSSWNKAKIKKAEIRSAVFPTESKLKLHYADENLVKGLEDISGNEKFFNSMLLKQGQVKIAKSAPIFHNWHFDFEIEFDQSIIDRHSLVNLLDYSAAYGGFGDFRPTYGRAKFVEVQ